MTTYINEYGEFVQAEPESPYASIMKLDMDEERERNLYRENAEARARILGLHARREQTYRFKCRLCGKEFETKSKLKIYCSDRCRDKWNNDRRKKEKR